MIDFHKVAGVPAKVQEGHEDVWFSYPGGIYVADNEGNPRLIAPGIQQGADVPVGVPTSPGIFFYNTSNKKHYISTDTNWLEIPTGAIPGSGQGGAGIAGNVLMEDTGGYYTSVDVEGALSEIAQKFPWYFGAMKLADYTGNVASLLESAEKYLTDASTNRPMTGWETQRKASNGKTYGFLVGDNGTMYTRVGDKFVKLADAADIDKKLGELSSNLDNQITNGLNKLSVSAGTGISVSGTTIQAGQTIGLSASVMAKLDQIGKDNTNGIYVKISGDTMTGNLAINRSSGQPSQLYLRTEGSANDVIMGDMVNGTGEALRAHPYGGKAGGSKWAISNQKTKVDAFSIYPSGEVDVYSTGLRFSAGNTHTGGGDTKSTFFNNSTVNSVDIKTPNNNAPLFVDGKNGAFLFLTPAGGWNYIASGGNNPVGGAKNLEFVARARGGGQGTTPLSYVSFNATHTNMTGNGYVAQSFNVGVNGKTLEGSGGANACLRIFPANNGYLNTRDPGAKNDHIVFYFNQSQKVLVMDSYRAPLSASKIQRRNSVKLSSYGFITRSSIEYKNPIRVFNDDALTTVKKVSPEVYAYKDDRDQKEQLGFIIEHGTPKEVVDGKAVDNYALTSYLWRAVQQLAAKVDELENKLAKQ